MAADRGDRLPTVQVITAMAVLAIVLCALAPHHGYHRDELYFRMLPPDWGYTDQPPLTPLLVQATTALFGDSLIALRLPAIVCAVASLPLLTAITHEVGGGLRAQALTLWGMAGATMTLLFGHVLLTASLDLVVWPATLLCVLRAVLREDPRWWLVAGLVVGLSTYNKLLVAVLLVGITLGVAALGPRRWLRSVWVWAAVALIGVLALPNLVHQAAHGWPQLEMGEALRAKNAAEVRVVMWPFLVLLVGPVLAVSWVAALVALLRRPEWQRLRFLVVTLLVVIAFVFVAGAQFYYPAGILAVLTAVGAVPVADWARTKGRQVAVGALVGANAAGAAVTSLPLLPQESSITAALAETNVATADQIGWPEYVAQVEDVVDRADADAVITSNYGEAGALDRFGRGLPGVHSGHNALWDLGGPADAEVVVIVGGQGESMTDAFEECAVVDELDHGLAVATEEQGEPITVCRGPLDSWDRLWPRFRHLS